MSYIGKKFYLREVDNDKDLGKYKVLRVRFKRALNFVFKVLSVVILRSINHEVHEEHEVISLLVTKD